jgi:hypothetical protein
MEVNKMKSFTFAQMEKANKTINHHWFDKGAINFFNTVFETSPNRFNLFITSERYNENQPKKYSLRWFNQNNSKVYTLGNIQQFETIDQAQKFMDICTIAFNFFMNREWDIMDNLYEVIFEKQRIIFKACYSLKDLFEYKFFAIDWEGRLIN